jgi:hypothetical protein
MGKKGYFFIGGWLFKLFWLKMGSGELVAEERRSSSFFFYLQRA